MGSGSDIPLLLIGLEDRVEGIISGLVPAAKLTRIASSADFEGGFETWGDGMFAAIFCGASLSGVNGIEMAQVLQNQCPATPKVFVTLDAMSFTARELTKNGFNEVFFLPLDNLVLKKFLLEQVVAGSAERTFRPVRIFDIAPGTVLEFDTYVFLPLNNKYVRLSAANQAIDQEKLDKLNAHHVSSIFVDQKDMAKFYAYAGSRLRDPGSGALSATERQERLRESVRSIFSFIFDASIKSDFNEAKSAMETVGKIISNYITRSTTSDWYDRFLTAFGETGDTYTHIANVSTLAALFAIGLGHKAPEDLALAGLFHDLGMTTIPEEIREKSLGDMTEEEKALYFQHPEKSLALVKGKRMVLTETVEKAILQHHEEYSGKGFPRQLPAGRISPEAQILSFADQFDYWTLTEAGKKRLTPLEAWQRIKESGSISPELLSQIQRLLQRETPSRQRASA